MASSLSLPTPEWRTITLGAALFTAGVLTNRILTPQTTPRIIGSPMKTVLPRVSKEELSELPYPPDFIPGGRDVDTPYGTIRAYEYGPEDGHKVLLVHGISTPCLALASVAEKLAQKGYRVMLFDLFGRGYSDAPVDLSQDLRLFTSQILCVLASSPLSWTGSSSDGFSLIGYSLGGAIGVGFTAYFPHLISSLILIAPAGVIRQKHISQTSKILYSTNSLFPEPLLQRLVKRRLRTPLAPPQKPAAPNPDQDPDKTEQKETEPLTAAQAEVNVESNPTIKVSEKFPNVSVLGAVQYQVEHHDGFVPAFMSSMRSGLPLGQEELWRKVGRHFAERSKTAGGRNGMEARKAEKVLIVSGVKDPIIIANELKEDAEELLGGLVEFRGVDGADHGLPVNMSGKVVESIEEFWRQ